MLDCVALAGHGDPVVQPARRATPMAVTVGTRLGPYEVIARLGAGGMGVVWRARDSRLAREVAIKVLHPASGADPAHVRRFEQEARAIGLLNHPGILAIHDVGDHEGSPYLVCELLVGESLRARLDRGRPTVAEAIGVGRLVAAALAAAHARGVVHRDIKPDNLFITRDGRVKILDFGLAKLRQPDAPAEGISELPTIDLLTRAGSLFGTVGYMSPEQVRTEPADHRSDIFSLGVVLNEMLSGRSTFAGASAVETMNAILNDQPPDLPGAEVPPTLASLVRHCLAKRPEERFQSAYDVALALEATSAGGPAAAPGVTPAVSRWTARRRIAAGAVALAALAVGAGYVAARREPPADPAAFRPLTYRRGTLVSARFAPDGETILYSAKWEGAPIDVYTMRADEPESRSLGFPGAKLLAVSLKGELLLALGWKSGRGTLAKVPLAGGAPRALLEDVHAADWSADGSEIAAVRYVANGTRLEFVPSRPGLDAFSELHSVRFSPRDGGVALQYLDDGVWKIALVDRSGSTEVLTTGWANIGDIAFSPAGDEVLFGGQRFGEEPGTYAVDLRGRVRLVGRVAGGPQVHDVSRAGRALVSRDELRGTMVCLPPGEERERDLSWLDCSTVKDIAADGSTLLFAELFEQRRSRDPVFLRRTDGSPAVRLGDGKAQALSPDGRWVATIAPNATRLDLLPTGPGQPRSIELGRVVATEARWFPDGQRLLVVGSDGKEAERCFEVALAGGSPHPITPPATSGTWLTLDGTRVLARAAEGEYALHPVAGGEPSLVLGLTRDDLPLGFSADGHSVYATAYQSSAERRSVRIDRIDLATGTRSAWRELTPPDPAGIFGIGPIVITADGRSYAYSYRRNLSQLFLLDRITAPGR